MAIQGTARHIDFLHDVIGWTASGSKSRGPLAAVQTACSQYTVQWWRLLASQDTINSPCIMSNNCEFEDLDVCDRATEESRKVPVGYAFEPRISGEVIQSETGSTSYRDAGSDDSDFDPDTEAQGNDRRQNTSWCLRGTVLQCPLKKNVFVVGKSVKLVTD